MVQPITARTFSPRTGSRVQAVLLCICLILPLAWHEPGFGASAHRASTPVAACVAEDNGMIRRTPVPHRLPALLAPTTHLIPGAGLRSGNRDDSPSVSSTPWAVAGESPRLPSLRIDPVIRDTEIPSLLLPSGHGLIPFATPPPRLA